MNTILNKLHEHKQIKTRKYWDNLIKDGLPRYGVNIPTCHEIAKELAHNNDLSILKVVPTYNEEKIIQGLIICYLKISFAEKLDLLKEYVLTADNWAVVDIVSSHLKDFKKNKEQGFEFIKYCFDQNTTYTIRFGYVLLLGYYIEEQYLDYIFMKIRTETSDEYYVKMAIAWLISYLYVKYPERTLELFDYTLDKFTNNKAISKIRESRRVSEEDKNSLLIYKIN